MALCYFGSPDLVTSVSGGATPTFAFDASNSNYFGLAGSFTSRNGAVCSFPTQVADSGETSTYGIIPLIITGAETTPCDVLAPPSIDPEGYASTTYSGIECPSVIDNSFAPGTYTLKFDQPTVNGVPTISSRVFIVAQPTASTEWIYTSTVFQTLTITMDPTSTTTVTKFSSTGTVTASSRTTTTTVLPITATSTSTSCSSTSTPTPSPTNSVPISRDGVCSSNGRTCLGSTFGNCCSRYGYCGSTNEYCLITDGCQPGFGTCNASPISSSIRPTPTGRPSPDGSCGGSRGYVCAAGFCCSQHGWCGDTSEYCGAGCQLAFGTCGSPTVTAPLPSSTLKISPDGSCAGSTGQTCRGSVYGDCCSQYGFCGRSESYCAKGCQPNFGVCTTLQKRFLARPDPEKAHELNIKRELVEREIAGRGPDFTYPPIPRTTSTGIATRLVVTIPKAGIKTSTEYTVTWTTVGVLTVTKTETSVVATRTATVCPKV